jgi:hypothetical protein
VLPVALAWGDGNLEVLELSWVLWAHAQLAQRQRSLLIAGGGEHYRGFAWRQEFLAAGKSNRVKMDNWLDMRLIHPMNTSLFAVDPTDAVRADFAERMSAWAEPYAEEPNTTQLDVMYAYKMTGHCGAYLSADHAYVSPELPYYLKDVFSSAISTNPRFRWSHRLMRHMLERLDPHLAAITTTSGGTAQPLRLSNVHRFAPYYGTLLRKAANKVSQKMGVPVMPTVAHFDPAPPAARRALLSSLAHRHGLTAADLRSGPLYRHAAIDEFLHAAGRGDRVDSALLGRIITVELALRAVDASVEA